MRISDWSSDVCSSDLVGGGQDEGGPARRLALRSQPVDRPRNRELGRAQAGHEVAPAHLASLLERLEHGVHAGEATFGHLSRSEERRVGKGWVSTCKTQWATSH